MSHSRGQRRALALLIGLAICLLPLAAYASEQQTEAEAEVTSEHKPEPKPEASHAADPTKEPEKEPAQTELPAAEATAEPEPTAPGEPTEDGPTEAQPEQQKDKQPDKKPGKREYSVDWADGAFSSQVVNSMDELILGVGNSYKIDPDADIRVMHNGEQAEVRSITYQSSNKKYASVTKGGVVTAERKGTAQLLATVELPDGSQKQLRKNIKVVEQPDISFAPDFAIVDNGGQLDLGQYARLPFLRVSPNVDANVRYEISAKSAKGGSKVDLDKSSGKLRVSFQTPGDVYVITASTYAGKSASFTLYLGKRASAVRVQSANGASAADGVLQVAAGESIQLQASCYAGDAPAARQNVSWQVTQGQDAATVDAQGVLSVQPSAQGRKIQVRATAQDGGNATGSLNILVTP